MIGMLGGIVAQTPFAIAISYLGWRGAIVLDAAIGVVIFAIIWAVVKDYPANASPQDKKVPTIDLKSFFNNAIEALKRWPNWASGIFAALLNLPIFLIGALFGSSYLIQVYHYSPITSAFICSMLYWGMLFGCPLFGFISDRFGSRKKPMLLGSIATAAAICLLMNQNCSFSALVLLFFVIGLGSSSQILAYPMVAERNPKDQIATGEGIAATLIMSGGAIFQPIVGWLIELKWSGEMVDNAPIYALSDFHRAFWLMPVAILLAIAILLPLRDSYGHSKPNV